LASVLKQGGYQTFFTGKWHLGESDYALPIAHGYDEMKAVGLYHLNAYTYGDPERFPDMSPELRAMFNKVTKGMLSGKAGLVEIFGRGLLDVFVEEGNTDDTLFECVHVLPVDLEIFLSWLASYQCVGRLR